MRTVVRVAIGIVVAWLLGFLLNISAAIVNPTYAPYIVRWGWFVVVLGFGVNLALLRPSEAFIAGSWHRASCPALWVACCAGLLMLYTAADYWSVNALWDRLSYRQPNAGARNDVNGAPLPKEPPPIPRPSAAVPEVIITAPPDFIYNLTWIPKKDLTPRTTLGANYDQPFLEIRKLPLWPPLSVAAVAAHWSVVGEDTKSIFLGSNHFVNFGATVAENGEPGSMFEIGHGGPSLSVADSIQVNLDPVSDDPKKMEIPPAFWNGFVLRMLSLQKRPVENVRTQGMWKDKMTVGRISLRYRAGDTWYTRNFRIEVAVDALPDGAFYSGFTIPIVEPEFRSPDDFRAMMKLVSTQY